MKESQQVLEWINMGRAEGRAEGRTEGRTEGRAEGRTEGRAEGEASALLRLLAKRFPPGAPVDLAAKIQQTTELEHLQNWFDLAWAVDSLDAFRQAASL
ncbi:MAG TPA: hypothetical protein VN688_14355 [Gemmataceae bacterium]|nr:hypothetical protein [Gemmataceae bacterium]